MNKEEFKAKTNQLIDDVDAKIQEAKSKRDSLSADMKDKYASSIDMLEAKKLELQKKCEELDSMSEEKWAEVKAGFSDASDSFKEGFMKLKGIFS